MDGIVLGDVAGRGDPRLHAADQLPLERHELRPDPRFQHRELGPQLRDRPNQLRIQLRDTLLELRIELCDALLQLRVEAREVELVQLPQVGPVRGIRRLATLFSTTVSFAPVIGLLLAPVVLSLLVLGAHFLRAGNLLMVVVVLVLLGLLGVRRPWAARAVQVALLLGAAEWVRTLVVLSALRVQTGQPVRRMVILLVTAASSLVFRAARLRRRYDGRGTAA